MVLAADLNLDWHNYCDPAAVAHAADVLDELLHQHAHTAAGVPAAAAAAEVGPAVAVVAYVADAVLSAAAVAAVMASAVAVRLADLA